MLKSLRISNLIARDILTAWLGTAAWIGLGAASSAAAADAPKMMPVKAAPATSHDDWSGFYVGGHFGYGGGGFGSGTNPALGQGVIFPPTITGLVGGFQAGYNWQLRNNVVLGIETDLSFPSPLDRAATGVAPFHASIDYFGTARSRVGYGFGALFPYVTGGLAWGRTKITTNDVVGNPTTTNSATHVGWTIGAGIEFPVAGNWTGKFEYDYVELGPGTFVVNAAVPPLLSVDPQIQTLKVGLNYKLGDLSSSASSGSESAKAAAASAVDDWSIHGQATFIEQAYPRFRSLYAGTNSLPAGGQGRETATATAFVGRRLWDGGELYFNPELAQGFGLNGTLGIAGFANGEAQKAGSEVPRIRAQRYFFRQTFGFGGAQETVDDGPNQLRGKRDIDRVTLTVGRFAIGDIFDNNAYAHDPRADFMNWAIWSSAAYDFPADLPGFTRGAVVELNRKDWALRAGLFQVPEEPNSDVLRFKTGGAVAELEERYAVFDQPGKLRLGAFANQGRTGSYSDAVAIASTDPATDINTAIVQTRQQRLKYGFYVNAEQAINKDVGVFARASWNDGRNEILSFTDIDASASAGLSVKGAAWGRPKDTFGISAAVNGLSGPHRQFLAAGGLGLLIGDGALNYREERILESYYTFGLADWAKLTFDYQFVANPAYNADRGPVSVYSARLHAEF